MNDGKSEVTCCSIAVSAQYRVAYDDYGYYDVDGNRLSHLRPGSKKSSGFPLVHALPWTTADLLGPSHAAWIQISIQDSKPMF